MSNIAAHEGRFGPIQFLVFGLSLASLSYAVATAPFVGIDLQFFHAAASDWVRGENSPAAQWPWGYPPFTPVLLAPIALLSFKSLTYVWLGLNLAAAAIVIILAIKLYGAAWPLKPKLYLCALLLALAPFRVCLRNGQVSLIVVALLLGALLASKLRREVVAGVLLGIALFKPSLAIPFLLYFLWKREWKTVVVSMLVPAGLTAVFMVRLGLYTFEWVPTYIGILRDVSRPEFAPFGRTTELAMLIWPITGYNWNATRAISLLVVGAAVVVMAFVFGRRRTDEGAQWAALSMFALWIAYHRTHDSVFLILPAALFINLLQRRVAMRYASWSLAGLLVFVGGVPGLLTSRLGLNAEALSANLLGFLALHVEQIVLQLLFWSLLAVAWKEPRFVTAPGPQRSVDRSLDTRRTPCIVDGSPAK